MVRLVANPFALAQEVMLELAGMWEGIANDKAGPLAEPDAGVWGQFFDLMNKYDAEESTARSDVTWKGSVRTQFTG